MSAENMEAVQGLLTAITERDLSRMVDLTDPDSALRRGSLSLATTACAGTSPI
jgi:hypothetical protein